MTMFDRDQFNIALEAYLDGDLSETDARGLEAYAASDDDAGRELRLARLMQQHLRQMPQPICPPEVTRAVLSTVRADARRSFGRRLRDAASLSWSTILRPSLAMGVFIGAVVAAALIGRPAADNPATPVTVSAEATPQEVEQALTDAKWALAYLSNVGRRTATTIRDDVLEEHVVQPVNRALNTAFDDDEPNIQ